MILLRKLPGAVGRLPGMGLRLLWVGLLLAVAGCESEYTALDRSQSLLPDVVPLEHHVVYTVHETAEAMIVDLLQPTALPTVVDLPTKPVVAARRKGEHAEALVLSLGSEGTLEEAQAPGGLTVLSEQGLLRSYGWEATPFDLLDQDASGSYAMLSRLGSGERLLRNTHEVAFVDLEASPEEAQAVRLLALPERPHGVVFSEGFRLGERERRLALVVMVNRVALVDMEDPNAEPAYILLNDSPEQDLAVEQVLFDVTAARVYLRCANVDDIFALRLAERESVEGKLDFDVAVDIIAAGDGPADMRTFQLEGTSYLAVVAEDNSRLVVVDVATSRVTSAPLPAAFNRLHVYEQEDEAGGTSGPMALLWKHLGSEVALVALAEDSQALERGVERMSDVDGRVQELVEIRPGTFVLVGDQVVRVLQPALGQQVSYETGRTVWTIGRGLLDKGRERLWVGPPRQSRVAYLDFVAGGSGELNLDAPIQQLLLLPELGRLVAIHSAADGYLSNIDLEHPSRGATQSVRGFLLAAALGAGDE